MCVGGGGGGWVGGDKSKNLKLNLVEQVQLLALNGDQPGVHFLAWTKYLLNNAFEQRITGQKSS